MKNFIFDTNKCTGCQACHLACTIENGLENGTRWRQVNTFNELHLPGIPLFHLSFACNHCLDAPCMKYCPALAFSRDEVTGAVLLDQNACIGCRYCTWVCPYDAPSYNESKGLVEKCTFCNHRLKEGKEPACVSACPTDALNSGPIQNGQELIQVMGFPEIGIKPAIQIIPFRAKEHSQIQSVNESELIIDELLFLNLNKEASKINLISEWTLMIFTFLMSILVGVFSASNISGFKFNPFIFLGAGFFGMILTITHLGNKIRAYRAILNWKNSWVSREIIAVSSFMCLSAICLIFYSVNSLNGFIISMVGFAALVSMDKIYHVVPQPTKNPVFQKNRIFVNNLHSASNLLNGIFFTALLIANPILALILMLYKNISYAVRKFNFWKNRQPVRWVLSVLRLTFGFVFPIIFWSVWGAFFYEIIIATVVLAEFIDRCEFYLEIDVLTPKKQMEIDLIKRMNG